MRYDPLGRLYEVAGPSSTTRFLYDGDELVAEYDGAGSILRRYVHGLGVDDPMAWFEGAGVVEGATRFIKSDHQGSVTALVAWDGSLLHINRYDEWGIPGSATQPNTGRFQYTGQIWIPEIGLYYYKARLYSPSHGRFMQTDPIGYDDGLNIYAHVGNDPVNKVDPTGLFQDGLDRAISRDEQALFNHKMSPQEFKERQQARGAGGVAAGGVVAAVVAGKIAVAAVGGIKKAVEIVRLTLSLAGVKPDTQPVRPPPTVTSQPKQPARTPKGETGSKKRPIEKPKIKRERKIDD